MMSLLGVWHFNITLILLLLIVVVVIVIFFFKISGRATELGILFSGLLVGNRLV